MDTDVYARTPIDMLLFCPACDMQHIDSPGENWDNPPHRSHLCIQCGHIWRPSDVPTNGVRAIVSKGKSDRSADPAQRHIWLPSAAKATHDLVISKVAHTPGPMPYECTLQHGAQLLKQIIDRRVTGCKAHRWIGWAQCVAAARLGVPLKAFKDINHKASTTG